jgi:hypothetical protein
MVVIMNNPTAFPSLHWVAPQGHNANENPQGMSLRDYFAAKAMTGLLTAEIVGEYSNEHVAEISYMIADAMLKAREA